ncbi:MAG: UDP-3-O-acyl-N-acetylglucosamine deacetylase, partial [Candidatus Omnitrophota bacterium]
MDRFQKTILSEGAFSGVGLHTGQPVNVTVKPAAAGLGIRFYKHGRPLEAWAESTSDGSGESKRCSWVGSGSDRVLTVEHFTSALAGLGIDNILVEVDGPEMPALDGGAGEYVRLLQDLGIGNQEDAPLEVLKLCEPVFVWQQGSALCAYPDERLSFHYVLDYDYPYLRSMIYGFEADPARYAAEVAPA